MDRVDKIIDDVVSDEFSKVEFGKVLKGSTAHYEIRPAIAFGMSGKPYTCYGVFNAETGVMETEARQIGAAREWVKALTAIAKGEPVNSPMIMTQAEFEDDEDEDEQLELPLH